VIPESCNGEDDGESDIPGHTKSPEAINVPRKRVCEVSEHCHSHQINTQLNAVQQIHMQFAHTPTNTALNSHTLLTAVLLLVKYISTNGSIILEKNKYQGDTIFLKVSQVFVIYHSITI